MTDPFHSLHCFVNTCSSRGQIGLFNDTTFIDEVSWEKKGSHSELITDQFKSLLSKNKLEPNHIKNFLCTVGPGSFTGIRVGVNFCKAFAFATEATITPLNHLELLAMNCKQRDRQIFACLDAQKNSVFLSQFHYTEQNWQPVVENQVVRIEHLPDFITQPIYLCGNGLERYIDFISPEVLNLTTMVENGTEVDLQKVFTEKTLLIDKHQKNHWSSIQPIYIKASAAEEKKQNT